MPLHPAFVVENITGGTNKQEKLANNSQHPSGGSLQLRGEEGLAKTRLGAFVPVTNFETAACAGEEKALERRHHFGEPCCCLARSG